METAAPCNDLLSLCEVVIWVASDGGRGEGAVVKRRRGRINPKALEVWKRWDESAKAVLNQIKSGNLSVIGTPTGGGSPSIIPFTDFQGAVLDRHGAEPFLWIRPPGDEHAKGGGEFQDLLFMMGERSPKWRRLAVKRADVMRLWPFSGAKIGRPKRSGWDTADEPLLAEMAALIGNGEAKSANDAARLVASRAAGTGTFESKQSRLAKRYRAWASENNSG
jgi:hypothetical protein